ncbi:MAG: YihY/virulence factor BrkB family protein [Oscillospiraceae bacterium]|nr:YihY/virulence factor BrkB family protein [Oscillospiraceae bacterium]
MKQRLQAFAGAMLEILMKHNILRAAAGLAYFLMMSIFPALICLYNMLGAMFPAREEIRAFFNGVLPQAATDTILEFLRYVSRNTSSAMLVAALAMILTCASSAYRVLGDMIGEMWGQRRFIGLREMVFSVVFSVVFLAVMYFCMILVLVGKWALALAEEYLPFLYIVEDWSWLRFVLLFLLVFLLLSLIYRFTSPKEAEHRCFHGALLGALAMLAVSLISSAVISSSTRYPLVYGSLASVIVLLFWFYVCGAVLFFCSAVNVALYRVSPRERRE